MIPAPLLFLLTAALALGAGAAPPGRRAASEADEVKAVFLLNFTKFVEWPPAAFSTQASPIVIAVLGDDPFDGSLDLAVAGETVNGRSIVIKRFKTVAELEPCHILFISASENQRVPEIIRRVRLTGTLTVGDTEGFAARGGAVEFRAVSGRMRFEISQEAADRAGLRVSARLLRLASAVRPRIP